MAVTFRAIAFKELENGTLTIVDIMEWGQLPGMLTVRNAKKMLRRYGDADCMKLVRGRMVDGQFVPRGRVKYTVF